jgi:SAM-dependent methyltransferase
MGNKKKHKQIFLESEADAWIERNLDAMSTSVQDYSHPILNTIVSLIDGGSIKSDMHVLEIGCGEGRRLKYIAYKWGASVYGIDPSEKAVALAKTNGSMLSRVQLMNCHLKAEI